jgi:hypothetical protein
VSAAIVVAVCEDRRHCSRLLAAFGGAPEGRILTSFEAKPRSDSPAPPSGETGLSSLEPISKSFEKDNEAGELDKAEEIVGVVFPANKDAALPLNPGEEALDEPAAHVAA